MSFPRTEAILRVPVGRPKLVRQTPTNTHKKDLYRPGQKGSDRTTCNPQAECDFQPQKMLEHLCSCSKTRKDLAIRHGVEATRNLHDPILQRWNATRKKNQDEEMLHVLIIIMFTPRSCRSCRSCRHTKPSSKDLSQFCTCQQATFSTPSTRLLRFPRVCRNFEQFRWKSLRECICFGQGSRGRKSP